MKYYVTQQLAVSKLAIHTEDSRMSLKFVHAVSSGDNLLELDCAVLDLIIQSINVCWFGQVKSGLSTMMVVYVLEDFFITEEVCAGFKCFFLLRLRAENAELLGLPQTCWHLCCASNVLVSVTRVDIKATEKGKSLVDCNRLLVGWRSFFTWLRNLRSRWRERWRELVRV